MVTRVRQSTDNLPTPVSQAGKVVGVVADAFAMVDPTTATQVKIAVIGDSTSTQNPLTDETWPTLLEMVMNKNGADVKVFDFSAGGVTFYGALHTVQYGIRTFAQAVIAAQPDIVIVCLGVIDAMLKPAGRSQAQIKQDAADLFTTLRVGLPNAKLMYSSQLAYDADNFIPSTLKNKGVIPAFFTLRSAGILSGLYAYDILDDASSSAIKQLYADWTELDLHVKALTTVDHDFTMNYWRAARLGCTGQDGLHTSQYGHTLQAGYALLGLRSSSFWTTLFPYYTTKENSPGEDPDLLFDEQMAPSGDGYTWTQSSIGESISTQLGSNRQLYPETWYTGYKAHFTITPNYSGGPSSFAGWYINYGPPNSTVYVSVDGAAFVSTGMASGKDGSALQVSNGSSPYLSPGAHTLLFSCGAEVYGPFAVTVVEVQEPFLKVRRNTAQALVASTDTWILFNAIDEDTHGGYNAGTGEYTVQVGGKYIITYAGRGDGIAASGLFAIALQKNGVRLTEAYNYVPSTGGNVSATLSCIVELIGGDVIKAGMFTFASGATAGAGSVADAGATMMTLRRLGF